MAASSWSSVMNSATNVMTNNVHCILLFSGKRKSGKDYITDILHEKLTADRSVILKLSGPIKSHWAKSLNLNLDNLMSNGDYKEKYRLQMVKWGENMRKQDYGYFCRAAIDMYNVGEKQIWIVSDVRRKSDIQWFIDNYGTKCKTVRILCNDKIRTARGWVPTPGIDDSETECDLDGVDKWDLEIFNEGESIENIIQAVYQLIGEH